MSQLPLLAFQPIYKEVVWGGRQLERALGKRLPGQASIGEAWELVDLPRDQSLVAAGPLCGTSLGKLRESFRLALLGAAPLQDGRFPLLFKFIDAADTLSVQVHPDEEACRRMGTGRPKTEAWYIIDCDEGAKLFAGLRTGTNREAFLAALAEGRVAETLCEVHVRPGDFVFLPAGTVHAIGRGILLAEVQQSSDTTYRVFDWNRVGLNGAPRELHINQALESIHFSPSSLPRALPPRSGRTGLCCPFFEMERVSLDGGTAVVLEGEGPCVLQGIVCQGPVQVHAAGQHAALVAGQTLVVPAESSQRITLAADAPAIILATRIPSGDRSQR